MQDDKNVLFYKAWDNWITYKEFDINEIALVNEEIARDMENKITAHRGEFASLYAGVKHGPELLYNPCPIYPAVVHAIKQELGYKFCKEHPEEINALFNALVDIAKAQDAEAAKVPNKEEKAETTAALNSRAW